MAHKVVLASCSPYLHSILMRLRHSHQQPVIFLSRINITDLTKLVTFMYTLIYLHLFSFLAHNNS